MASILKDYRPSPVTPLLAVDSPDPSVKIRGNTIHLYTTNCTCDGSCSSARPNIQEYVSHNLWKGPWKHRGGALHQQDLLHQPLDQFWAPDDPLYVRGEERLYYTGGPYPIDGMDERGMGIALAVRKRGSTKYRPVKRPVVVEPGYSAIDPRVVDIYGDQYLFFGSHYQPIRCIKLAPNGYEPDTSWKTREVLKPRWNRPYMRLLEGFYVKYHRKKQVWFAFVSGDNTWRLDRYAITMLWSDSPFGPYQRIGVILEPSDRWLAPGQNSIAEVGDDWYLVYHAVDALQPYIPGTNHLRRVACVSRLDFAGPLPQLAPVVGANDLTVC